jgi:hypothetical protein
MKIIELRILPPIAIGRLGSSPTPLSAFDLEVQKQKPLDFRSIVPKKTFEIDKETGQINANTPKSIRFKDADSWHSKNGTIRPVAPFLEVFAITDTASEELIPLTLDILSKAGLTIENLSWDVELGNIKVFRRTSDVNDKIYATITDVKDHKVHQLLGKCENFLPDKTLPLGNVQFINPSDEFPTIRLRFTPAEGKVYGSSLKRKTSDISDEHDPIITNEDLILYDISKGHWQGYAEDYQPPQDPNLYTNPGSIYAGYSRDSDGAQVSWGYLDDECDGFISVNLNTNDNKKLTARAYVGAGPPTFAPDTMPVRVVSDELEQILLGPEIENEVPIEEAEEIVRRALETVRLLNTSVMNGNPVDGRLRVASTMVSQDTNDFGRYYEPIMAVSLVDNLALRTLHERVFNGLATGAAPWFAQALRRPDEIGDLSNEGRRKMPAMMRGADARALTLTHRMINTVIKAAVSAMFRDSNVSTIESTKTETGIKATNLTAQLHYRGEGNPMSVLPRTAISNCFPGLEFDFRNLWRRTFKEIVLIENNNYVIDADEAHKQLIHCRLVAIDEKPTMVQTTGPIFPNGASQPLTTSGTPPVGASFMEWSNAMAHILQKQGEKVTCYFTLEAAPNEVLVTKEDLIDKTKFQSVELEVNRIFDGGSAAFSTDIIQPGELTQGLCAPWQNDYRECACYYWAASRPDFVNVVPDEKGLATGDNWMSKKRTGNYLPDNRTDNRLISYDDLFRNWEGELNFIIKGKDALETSNHDK